MISRHSGTLVKTSRYCYRLDQSREPINWKIPSSYSAKQLVYAINFAKQNMSRIWHSSNPQ